MTKTRVAKVTISHPTKAAEPDAYIRLQLDPDEGAEWDSLKGRHTLTLHTGCAAVHVYPTRAELRDLAEMIMEALNTPEAE